MDTPAITPAVFTDIVLGEIESYISAQIADRVSLIDRHAEAHDAGLLSPLGSAGALGECLRARAQIDALHDVLLLVVGARTVAEKVASEYEELAA